MLSNLKIVLLAVTFVCSAVSANAATFTGGPGDGHSAARASRVTLNGINAGAKFNGGNGDGYSYINFLSDPSSSVRQWNQYERK